MSLTSGDLAASVIAVPPLSRNGDLTLNLEENRRLIHHIEKGGVKTVLYGGNANLYHVSLHEYEPLLSFLEEAHAPETVVIPSLGPAYGTMMEQARIARQFDFPTVMVLPPPGVFTSTGMATGVRHVAEAYGKPLLLYIKTNPSISLKEVKDLVDDGVICAIKYAIVRENPLQDPYLEELVEQVDPSIIISGIGEQPAIAHMRQFDLVSFTSGCVCIAPALSMTLLKAVQAGDYEKAEAIRRVFSPLEDLRNGIHPVRVLHDAVSLAGIARMGPLLPLLSNLEADKHAEVKQVALGLLNQETTADTL